MDTSREWTKPELTVLGRGAPEENVLCHCKTRPSGSRSGCGKKNKHTNCFEPGFQYHTS
jgi:hypothetical protein